MEEGPGPYDVDIAFHALQRFIPCGTVVGVIVLGQDVGGDELAAQRVAVAEQVIAQVQKPSVDVDARELLREYAVDDELA